MPYDPDRHNRQSVRLKGYDYSQPGYFYVTICTQDRVERFGTVSDPKMVLNDAGELVDEEWNRIPERYDHVVLDEYKIMPNHMRGIVKIISLGNGGRKTIDPGTVGTGFMPVLNDGENSIENGHNDLDSSNISVFDEHRKTSLNSFANTPVASGKINNGVAVSEMRGIKPLPTPLYDIIGTFKSILQNDYAFHVRNNGWPRFEKRLWQLRFHDHIIRNENELNRIRKYIENHPTNWAEDENNPENIGNDHETDS